MPTRYKILRGPGVYMRLGSFSGGTRQRKKDRSAQPGGLRPGDAVRRRRDSWRPGQRRGRPSATSFRGWEAARVTSAPGGANLAKSGAQRGGHQPPLFLLFSSFFLRPFSPKKKQRAALPCCWSQVASRSTCRWAFCLLFWWAPSGLGDFGVVWPLGVS